MSTSSLLEGPTKYGGSKLENGPKWYKCLVADVPDQFWIDLNLEFRPELSTDGYKPGRFGSATEEYSDSLRILHKRKRMGTLHVFPDPSRILAFGLTGDIDSSYLKYKGGYTKRLLDSRSKAFADAYTSGIVALSDLSFQKGVANFNLLSPFLREGPGRTWFVQKRRTLPLNVERHLVSVAFKRPDLIWALWDNPRSLLANPGTNFTYLYDMYSSKRRESGIIPDEYSTYSRRGYSRFSLRNPCPRAGTAKLKVW